MRASISRRMGAAIMLSVSLSSTCWKKRRAFYQEVCEAFADYVVFVGGSSSFDMAPKPYNKYYALDLYCRENGLAHENVLFIGDDYGQGGNDESVYLSDIPFLCVDDYTTFPALTEFLL